MISHWFLAISVSHADCPLFYASSIFKPLVSISQGEPSKTLWISVFEAELSRLEGSRKIAIVMNAPTFTEAEDVDYFVTNYNPSLVSSQWIIDTYSQRNWVEVFYREVKGWLGLKEYQVRSLRSLKRHFNLV